MPCGTLCDPVRRYQRLPVPPSTIDHDETESRHVAAEKDWREQESLRGAAEKNRQREAVAATPVVATTDPRDVNNDGVWDRILYGAVADFFYLHAFGYGWYVFNIADIAVVLGVMVMGLDLVLSEWRARIRGAKEDQT